MKRMVRTLVPGAGFALALAALAATVPADAGECPNGGGSGGSGGGGSAAEAYRQTNLVASDKDEFDAREEDRDLINAWGVAMPPSGEAMVASEGTGTGRRYDGNGELTQVIDIPGVDGRLGHPTGVVYNRTQSFSIKDGASRAAQFIFAGADGIISAWHPDVDRDDAIEVIDTSRGANRAAYLGITIASDAERDLLYAADFRNGRVVVWDTDFDLVRTRGGFADPRLPAGYAPFNIQNINGALFVTYAVQSEDRDEEETGEGLGLINIFDTDGNLLRRLVEPGGELDAPWGLALARADFGRFSDTLLVGNFGDGRILSYDIRSGRFNGALRDARNDEIEIEGLWGLAFGNGTRSQARDALFFAAGPDDEEAGLYGRIVAVSEPPK